MAPSNYKRHLATCAFKNIIALTKSELELMKSKHSREEESQILEMSFMELKHFLTESYQKANTLYRKIVVEDNRDPIEKIKEMRVSESTLNNYLLEWKLYNKWLKANKKSVCVETANTYIASLKRKSSTQRKKQYVLQLLLQHLIDKTVKLDKFNMRISYAPKRSLTNEELRKYLEEQREISMEDYLMQRLLATYGLRINTVALLKIKDLEFLLAEEDEEERFIHLPDSKVKNYRVEPIERDLEGLLREFIGEGYDDEDFIFYSEGKDRNSKRRAQDLCQRINRRIRDSKAMKKRPNYKYTSHMFRKTKAYNLFNTAVAKLKEEVRASIGQSSGSTAVEHYIN